MPAQTTFPEIQIRPILKFQFEYPFDGAFDRIVRVRRLESDMTTEITNLTILPFPETINSQADLIPPAESCYFRTGNGTSSVYIRDDETPEESEGITYLEVTFVNTFCRAVVDSEINKALLAAAEKNASNGIKTMRVERPDLATVAECQAVAEALRDEFEKTPITVGPVRTRQSGLESGQTMTYTSPKDNQAFEVTITSVSHRVVGGAWMYEIMLQMAIAKTPKQRQKEAIRRARQPLVARKTIIDTEYPID